jgi:hypothetical protein
MKKSPISLEQILEGNILIAHFMDWTKPDKRFKIHPFSIKLPFGFYIVRVDEIEGDYEALADCEVRPNDLIFNVSWEWMIPVVEKIESIHDTHHGYFGVSIYSNSCSIQGTLFRSDSISDPPIYYSQAVSDTKILATWLAVVNFITWYNGQGEHIRASKD